MSRASDVRDAVIAAIAENLTGQTVEAFIVPSYTREELTDGPRVAVRYGARELAVDMGPDERRTIIEVGVIGVTPVNETHDATNGEAVNDAAYRAAQIAACDGFDGLMEQVIELWTPNGVLSRAAMADHRFVSITQVIQFDATKLYTDGIWLSMISLEYQDCSDE
tara:strand:- start:393 stop:887 length:495 start_codon:yes stop_codon:yes gene_type:complete